jgi:transposase
MGNNDTITIPLSEYQALQATIAKLQHEIAWLKRQIFGQKSERFIPNDQQTCLDLDVPEQAIATKQETITYTRTRTQKTAGHGRGEMPTHLPIKDTVIEPQEDVSAMTHIGDEVSWEYEYDPGTLFINRFVRPKYVRPDNAGIVTAELPPRAIDKGNFGPGLMSTVVTDKYLYHMPLHRQRQKYLNEFKVDFAESTFCDLIARSVFWMEPVYALQKSMLLQSTYLQADETPIPVLIKNKTGKTHTGYYWVYYDPIGKVVIFEYRTGRGREGPNEFLKEFKGTVQVDGYTGYDELMRRKDIVRAACMAHVRRKFEAALEFDRTAAEYALGRIGAWFEKERDAKEANLSYEQRRAIRQELLHDDFASFRQWMLEQVVNRLPKDLIRKACEYGIGQWDGFNAFLNDGRVELSNNLVENAIRPVALGRKNYLFKGSHEAAQRGAIIYSLVATAKLHGQDPYRYIKMLLEKLPAEKSANIEKYLPQNICN